MSATTIYFVHLAIYLHECNRVTSEPGMKPGPDELRMPVDSARKVLAMGKQACSTPEQLKDWFLKKIEEIKKQYIGPTFYPTWLERFREEVSTYLKENEDKVAEGNDFAKMAALLQKLPGEIGPDDEEAIKAVRSVIRVQVFQRQIFTYAKQRSGTVAQTEAPTPEAQAQTESKESGPEDPWPHEEYLYFALHTLVAIINAAVLSELEQAKIKLTDRLEACVVAVQEYTEQHPSCLAGSGPHAHTGYRFNAISALVCDRLIAQLMQTGPAPRGKGKGKSVLSMFASALPATTVYAILCDMKANQWRLLEHLAAGGLARAAFSRIDMDKVRSARQLPPLSTPKVGPFPTGAEGGEEAEVGVWGAALMRQQNLDEELPFQERVGQFLRRVEELEMHPDVLSVTAYAGHTRLSEGAEGGVKKQRVA